MAFLQQAHLVRLNLLTDGDLVTIGTTQIRPFRLAEDYSYAFLLEGEGKRVLIVADELFGWQPPHDLGTLDLAVLPMGLVEFHPFTRERLIAEDHPVLKSEATFEQTLDVIRHLHARRVILSHIEEPDGLGYDQLQLLARNLHERDLKVDFAWDGMITKV